MNYLAIYNRLIDRGKDRNTEDFTEIHHIIPRCMGGNDSSENLVRLTPEEHYVAHQLLVKIYPDNYGLAKAAMMMTVQRTNNKVYGWIRRRHALAMSKSQSGTGNSQYGTRWIHNVDLKESKKISVNEYIPEGWSEGRVINFNKKLYERKSFKREENRIENKKLANKWYTEYINSNANSLREFVRNSDYDKSHVSFIKMLKTYVPEFNPEHGKAFKS
jgi:hypothetical protein